MTIEKFIEDSNAAVSNEGLIRTFEAVIKKIGYDKFVYSHGIQGGTDDTTEHGIAVNYPEDWMRHYAANDYLAYDPTYPEAKRTNLPFTWESLRSRKGLNQKNILVLNEAEEAGLHNGISLSIHQPGGLIFGMGLASDAKHDKETDKNGMSVLYALIHQFHVAYSSFRTSAPHPSVVLTEREREILLWSMRGKSKGVIAEIIDCSKHTVDFHLRNIYRKLEVNNIMPAVLKAISLRLIDP
jgi:LuxR family quorum-sensing system transcriptional regulator CciR